MQHGVVALLLQQQPFRPDLLLVAFSFHLKRKSARYSIEEKLKQVKEWNQNQRAALILDHRD